MQQLTDPYRALGLSHAATDAEIKAAQPAKGYMGRYGNAGGNWTTDRFIEAVYRSMPKEKP